MNRYLVATYLAIFTSPPLLAGDDQKPLLDIQAELTKKDDLDALLKKSHAKVHTVKLDAGKSYRIDLSSKKFDPYLRVENSDKKTLARDDDSGGALNARILFPVPKDEGGEYRLIVTSFRAGDTGEYNLRVSEASKADILQARLQKLAFLPPAEHAELLEEFRKHLATRGKDLALTEAHFARMVAMNVELRGDLKKASEIYRDLGTAFGLAADPKINKMSRMMEGAGRRLDLVGNAIEIKGSTVDGKPFDWAPYKGKVVLIHFWATWSFPFRRDLPVLKKLYDAYHDRGFEVVGISLDRTADIARDFMTKEKLPWVCLFVEEGKESLTEFYGIFRIPQAFLVDRDGRVVSLRPDESELPRLLEKLIGPTRR